MKYSFAPLEGITGYVFRNIHHKYFGEGIDAYYTPFVVSTYTKKLKTREKKDILPENNEGIPLIPQILANSAEDFLYTAEMMKSFGYRQVNLNLGCPVRTVTAKKKGSGMLEDPEGLDRLLYGIFEGAAGAGIEVSVKTRLGVSSVSEADRIFAVYEKYPLKELIVHARTRKELYAGYPELDAFGKILESSPLPLCYNGNIFAPEDMGELSARFPSLSGVMIGRGLIADPALVRKIRTGKGTDQKELRAFHDELYDSYLELYSARGQGGGDRIAVNRMKEIWTYFGKSFAGSDKYLKAIFKASSRIEYEAGVRMLFTCCSLQNNSRGLP